MNKIINENIEYISFLNNIKSEIKTAQIKAHLAVNQEMLILYWKIGKNIINARAKEKWGSKVINNIASDLKEEFSTIKGFSTTNLKYMAIFFENYPDLLISQQTADQLEKAIFINEKISAFLNIPWFHNVEIISKVKTLKERLYYAQKTIENAWSRNVLVMQISRNLYEIENREKINNFKITLPEEASDLANEIFKDEYNFEFIDNSKGRLLERNLEKALTDDIIKFLTELGKGFAFVGKQYKLDVGGEEYYIDLLFYHIKLKSYIVIELKTRKFKPEYVGKLGFYLACVDDYLKDEKDNSSIGIILCQDSGANDEVRKKSLQYMIKPIGISNYTIATEEAIPKGLEALKGLTKLIKN